MTLITSIFSFSHNVFKRLLFQFDPHNLLCCHIIDKLIEDLKWQLFVLYFWKCLLGFFLHFKSLSFTTQFWYFLHFPQCFLTFQRKYLIILATFKLLSTNAFIDLSSIFFIVEPACGEGDSFHKVTSVCVHLYVHLSIRIWLVQNNYIYVWILKLMWHNSSH